MDEFMREHPLELLRMVERTFDGHAYLAVVDAAGPVRRAGDVAELLDRVEDDCRGALRVRRQRPSDPPVCGLEVLDGAPRHRLVRRTLEQHSEMGAARLVHP